MKSKSKARVAIQGITTSFHEVAALTFFSRQVETIECDSFNKVCETLKNDEADFAVMAIENSIAGSILPNYFLLQQNHFNIVGELYLPIHMHLLARPGVTLKNIKTIESHPMAIRQCSEFLHALNGIEIRESDDTALSARRISQLKSKTSAAIANEQAARKFGLEVIVPHIETHKKNFTRFLLLTKKKNGSRGTNKASLCFEVANQVGSLADALLIFKKNHINLSKIQSVPVIGKPSEYSIHVDIEWRKREDYENAMKKVIREVHNLSVLGEYKKAKMKF